MSLFRKKRTRTPLFAAFIGGSAITLAGVAYAASRLLKKKSVAKREATDYTDSYLPPGMKPGSRRSVHATV